jgi:hypothetical protein
MRFLRYISEERQSTEKWVETIKSSCQQYLSESPPGSRPLLRGLHNPVEDGIAIIRVNLQDRPPRDTNLEYHKIINQYFIDRFGYPFRNGVFATTSEPQASMYGEPHYFIPVGQYRVLGSPTVEDMTDLVSEIEYMIDRNNDDNGFEMDINDYSELIISELDEHAWLTSLPDLLKRARGCEWMFYVERYLAISRSRNPGLEALIKLGLVVE